MRDGISCPVPLISSSYIRHSQPSKHSPHPDPLKTLQRMRKAIIISLLSCFAATAGAQTFIDRLQKKTAGQGVVTVTQDEAVSNLVNGPRTATAPSRSTSGSKSMPMARKTESRPATGKVNTETTVSRNTVATESEAPRTTTSRTRKVTGYRVQAFAGGNTRQDRQNAEKTGNRIKSAFPDESIYVHFYSPRWICRVGNYKTYEEAHRMLEAIQGLGYKQASIVKGKISVQY